jgi:hypothetical protein
VRSIRPKDKLTGAKPPLRPKHVWSIRTKLQIEGRTRDPASFNLAVDSKLRGCDVVAIRAEGGDSSTAASVIVAGLTSQGRNWPRHGKKQTTRKCEE